MVKEGHEPNKIFLSIDRAEQLAGLKISITYDQETLSFVKAEKSEATSSFLHVVNDKTPGKIIIVMASAKGISGENVILLSLDFVSRVAATEAKSEISVIQMQLMDENLKVISGNLPEFIF